MIVLYKKEQTNPGEAAEFHCRKSFWTKWIKFVVCYEVVDQSGFVGDRSDVVED